MSILKKILLVIIIILFSFIILSLLQERKSILNKIQVKEGLTINNPDYNYMVSSVDKVAMDPTLYSSGINSVINSSTKQLPLNQLCIKASYNSAYTGKYISDVMIKYVLSRGCRFLDFEVYYLPDSKGNYITCVGYSTDPNAINPTISNSENIHFIDIFQSTLTDAFIKSSSSTYTIVNTKDPLFINIRMKTSKEDMKVLFDSIQNIINVTSRKPLFQQYFTKTKIDGNTILNSIDGKVIIIFEKNDLIDYSNSFYNIISNSEKLTKSTYGQIDVNKYIACPPKVSTDTKVVFNCNHTFNYVVPDNYYRSQNNPDIFSSIKEYGNQITTAQYYVSDNYLIEYENIFKTYNSAFVSMSNCLFYINKMGKPSNIISPKIIGF